MKPLVRSGVLSLTRNLYAFLAPILVYAVATAGMVALVALVTASAAGGGNTGALTIFLFTTAVGLLAISCSVIDVVRAGFDDDLAAMNALGVTPAGGRVFTAIQSLGAFVVSLPVGLAAASPTYAALLWLLRVGGFHGIPIGSPPWGTALLSGITVTAAMALIGGWRARPLRATPTGSDRRRLATRSVRFVVGVAALFGAVALLSAAPSAGLGALFGSALVWVIAAVLLAPGLFSLLCLLPGLARRWPLAWPARVALTRDRLFQLSSSVTISTLAVVLFTALVAMVGTVERVQRAALVEMLTPEASVITTHDGALLSRESAARICAATPHCVGLIEIAPDTSEKHGTAYGQEATRRALFTGGAGGPVNPGEPAWTAPSDGLTGSPWHELRDGAAPALPGAWHALPVLTTTKHVAVDDGDATAEVARSWASGGPAHAVLSGDGTGDIAPMLAPLVTLSLLFSAASVYLLSASFHGTARVTSALGATGTGDLLMVLSDAVARTLTVYLLTLGTWWVMAHGAARAANHAVTPSNPPALLHLSFLALLLITAVGGHLGTRAGKRLA